MVIRDEVLPTLIFFNEEEARIVEAMTARIIPSHPGNPGAKEAGAVVYIDRALAGFFSPLQTFYREGIAEFDRVSQSRFESGFLCLSESQQDEFLRSIEGSLGDERLGKLSQFFAVVYQHTFKNVKPLLSTLPTIPTALIRFGDHVIDFLRDVALHDDLVNTSCILRNRPACRKSLSE